MRSMPLLASDEFPRCGALSYYACSCRSVLGSAGMTGETTPGPGALSTHLTKDNAIIVPAEIF